MKIIHDSPEWQARQDWRQEGVFHPERFTGERARRYRREAERLEREWQQSGEVRHVGAH